MFCYALLCVCLFCRRKASCPLEDSWADAATFLMHNKQIWRSCTPALISRYLEIKGGYMISRLLVIIFHQNFCDICPVVFQWKVFMFSSRLKASEDVPQGPGVQSVGPGSKGLSFTVQRARGSRIP